MKTINHRTGSFGPVSHGRQDMTTIIIIIAALAIFFTWNTNRAKNVIKARIYREYGYDPDIEKLSGAELMKMNDRMDEMGIRSTYKE